MPWLVVDAEQAAHRGLIRAGLGSAPPCTFSPEDEALLWAADRAGGPEYLVTLNALLSKYGRPPLQICEPPGVTPPEERRSYE